MTKETGFFNLRNLSKEDKYKAVISAAKPLVEDEKNITANLSNLAALLKEAFEYYSWIGFYIFEESKNQLVLGPFQGRVACTRINIGKGVCGTAAAKRETIVVEDVNLFPGHIFCDSESKSEIVVPIINDGRFFGVLDADSREFSSFDNTDKEKLEELINTISFIFR
ncbi:MAG: GAF domain-containing protein [Bacteroidetes bacterium]|nr:GAF domain-containing protein [Bacteroidota bacterium]